MKLLKKAWKLVEEIWNGLARAGAWIYDCFGMIGLLAVLALLYATLIVVAWL